MGCTVLNNRREARSVRMNHWRLVLKGGSVVLYGFADGHPDFEDGEEIFSSPVTRIEGKKVFTDKGRCYLLGTPAPYSKMVG